MINTLPPNARQSDEIRNWVMYVTTTFNENEGEIWVSPIDHRGFQTLSYPQTYCKVATIKHKTLQLHVSDADIYRWVLDYVRPLHLKQVL